MQKGSGIINKEIYVFVDNSNIFIEAQKGYATKMKSPSLGHRYRLDFGKLFEYISNDRGNIFFTKEDIHYPKLYGSEPPKMDSLWRFLENLKVDVNVFTRNAFNKEKGVDAALVWDVAELVINSKKEDNINKIIAIAGGDQDFLSLYDKGREIGFQVEYYCWEHSACHEIKELPTFHNLTPEISNIGFVETDRFEHSFGEIDWSKVVSYNK